MLTFAKALLNNDPRESDNNVVPLKLGIVFKDFFFDTMHLGGVSHDLVVRVKTVFECIGMYHDRVCCTW